MMDHKKAHWNSQQKLLRGILLKADQLELALKLCLEQHAMVHTAEMSGIKTVTFEDQLWEGLDQITFRSKINKKGRTIAYGLWHSTRIEDITLNLLVVNEKQVIDRANWLERINSSRYDTGNAMTASEIIEFSQGINMEELRNYRITVGRKTREIIQKLDHSALKRKVAAESLQSVLAQGAVLNVEGAKWLIDYWSKRNIAGILLGPATRHHLVHLNESFSAKNSRK